jgi:glycosyltransferase involved in cell wall biosynthesis
MSDRLVFYFTRMLPAYRLPIMERLNERLDGRLVVCYGQPPHDTSTLMGKSRGSFEQIRLKNYWFRGETAHAQPFGKVFSKYGPPAVVLAEESPRSITLPFLLRHARRQGAGRVLWGIFYSVFRPFSIKHPLQRYRIEMAKRVEACACYTRGVKKVLGPYIPNERLFVAQNTLDTDTLFALRKNLEAEGKSSVRRRLGIPEDHAVFAFTGQLVARKGTEELLDTFSRFRSERPATLIVIGGGPERQNLEARVANEGIRDVHFLGSIPRLEDSAPYLFASDLMLLPGYVGLVANHAFAMGLPIVTQEAPAGIPFHGPEVESIVDGENGRIVERDNPDALYNAVREILDNQAYFSKNAIQYVEQHLTLDNMVNGLVSAIQYAESHRSG